jgi:serine/threonine-protein kinase HipA
MDDILYVYLHNVLAGQLIRSKMQLSFQYDASYLDYDKAQPISAALPLQIQPFVNDVVKPFFSGLLPEGLVRVKLSHLFQTSPDNIFGLLREIGTDCAGAITVLPPGQRLACLKENSYKFLSDYEAAQILSTLNTRPLYAGSGDFRVSGAGAQDKLIACLIDNKLALPLHGTPSTHIFKTAIQDFKGSVFNEYFCMQLAELCGLNVPPTAIHLFDKIPCCVITRYDRKQLAYGQTVRLHQEDFCQILAVDPESKYESEGGPNCQDCFDLLNCLGVSGTDRIQFLEMLMFNFLIGNGDAHAKNFSILYEGKCATLAPFYDLMSTILYAPFAPKHKMAMKLPGSNYLFRYVHRKYFENLHAVTGFRKDFILKRLDGLLSKIVPLAERLNWQLTGGCASDIYAEIIKVIEHHVAQIADRLNEAHI